MDFVSRFSKLYFFQRLCFIFYQNQRLSQWLYRYFSIRLKSIMAPPPEPPKHTTRPGGLAQQANYKDCYQEPADIVGMTKEEFEKQKMLFSSYFLLGLEARSTNTTKRVVREDPEDEASHRPPPLKRTDRVHKELLGAKETFNVPPKRVLFKPSLRAANVEDLPTSKVKPTVSEKIVEITNAPKRVQRKYSDYLRRAGLELKEPEPIESSNQDKPACLRHVPVPWHLLPFYRALGLEGIYFYAENEAKLKLTKPKSKLEPWDVDPAWYLKSSEFMAIEPVKLGNEHVHPEHVDNVLLMYSSRRGISSKDRTYYKRHGPAGPEKYQPFKDAGRDRKRQNKYPPSYYRGYLANYLDSRGSMKQQQKQPMKIYKLEKS